MSCKDARPDVVNGCRTPRGGGREAGRGCYLEGSGGRKEGAKGTLGIDWNPLPEGVSVSGRVQAGNLQQQGQLTQETSLAMCRQVKKRHGKARLDNSRCCQGS